MKIALLAPCYSLKPVAEGGAETFLYSLILELIKRGHAVTTFTAADSKIPGTLIPITTRQSSPQSNDPYLLQSREIAGSVKTFTALENTASSYDIIHNNQMTFYSHLKAIDIPNCITTLHTPPYYYSIKQAQAINPRALSERVVAISDFQAQSSPINFTTRIYNGIDLQNFTFQPKADSYLTWIGRIRPTKGLLEAIKMAASAGAMFKFAGTSQPSPYIASVEKTAGELGFPFLGRISVQERNQLLGQARAFIFPIEWDEPFGLAMVEAMACGTPVIAYNRGAVPELVEDGKTGFICQPGDEAGFVAAIQKMMAMAPTDYQAMRQACRARVEQYFTIERMVDQYEALYGTITGEQ